MKVSLEFNLPEDNEEYEHHTKCLDYYCAIRDITEYLRSKTKYTDQHGSFQEVREAVADILSDRGIDW